MISSYVWPPSDGGESGDGPAGTNGAVQFNNANAFGADSTLNFSTVTKVLSARAIALTPAIGGQAALEINAPTGISGPVVNIKSNGSQTAYISDAGNAFFQNAQFATGINTLNIAGYLGADIPLQNNLVPNVNNAIDLGDSSHSFRTIRSFNYFGGDFNGGTVSVSTALELQSQGSSAIKWQGNSHVIRWLMGGDPGSDQVWNWPGDHGGGGFFQIDGSGNIAITSGPLPPGLGTVLTTSNDAVGLSIVNFAGATGSNGANLSIKAGSGGGSLILDGNSTGGGSGSIILGQSSSDTLFLVAGDVGGTPSNPATPVKFLTVKDNGGSIFYIALYQ